MITVNNFDDADLNSFKSKTEIHQSISSLRYIADNTIDLRSHHQNANQFSELNTTATTLCSSLDNKIEELNFRKKLLLKKRNNIFDSLLCRLFNFGRDKINIIDEELDKIEEQIYSLRKPELKKEILLAKDLIKKTSKILSKYKSESNEIL